MRVGSSPTTPTCFILGYGVIDNTADSGSAVSGLSPDTPTNYIVPWCNGMAMDSTAG